MQGNVMVGQSGGPTAVINASLAGVFDTAVRLGAKTVYGMRYGIEGFLKGSYADLGDYLKGEEEIALLRRTPSAFLGSCRYKLPDAETGEAVYQKIFRLLDRLDIRYFFYIGGNDSMDTIDRLSRYAGDKGSGIRFIGVPKTIDNDLVCTDHTPGYGSAAKYIASSTKELIRDSRVNDIDAVTVLEIMGRDAGWLTGSAAVCRGEDSDGPDLVYLPEIPFDMDAFLESVRRVQKKRRSVVVAVSEGVRSADGRYVCEYADTSRQTDAFGHKQLTGTARVLTDVVRERFGCKVRAVEFSSLQRCAAHMVSGVDLGEAFMVGEAAAKAADQNLTGQFICIDRIGRNPYASGTGICGVGEVANKKKDVPRAWINEEGNGVTDEFVDYVTPLIQGEPEPMMENGLPRHLPPIRD